MTNKEAIRILGLECDEWDISHCTASERREAFGMAITALQELDINPTKPNNSNDEVNNSTATQSNGIESKVKGLTACRVPEDDCISRRAAIDAILAVTGNSSVRELYEHVQQHGLSNMWSGGVNAAIDIIIAVPSVQTEPLPDAYMKAVWTWLLDYQIKAAELKGRYTPYEVLSWVANDWRKEYEGSD